MGAGLLSALGSGLQVPGQVLDPTAQSAVPDMGQRENCPSIVDCIDLQLYPDTTPVLVPDDKPCSNYITCADHAAVPGMGSWGSGLPVDTGLSAALDYTGVVVGCSSEGRAVVGLGSQNTSYTDTSSVVALSSPACNTTACVGHHGGVVQLSSSSHQVSPSPRL